VTAIRDLIARHPIASYIVIAFTVTYALTFAATVSIAFALVALFGPAFAAIVVSRAEGSWPRLRARITAWRRPIRAYTLAIGIPFGIAAAARLILEVTGQAPAGLGTITAIEAVIFVLVIGEEIGWRGFLQPRLRTRLSLGAAGLATGVVWTLWHLPIYLAPEAGPVAFLQFAWWVLPLSVVMGAVTEDARWSVIVATVMHGAANIATPILLPGIDRSWWLIVTGALYAIVAIGLVARAHRRGTAGPVVEEPATAPAASPATAPATASAAEPS
jgi:membrane protease YdiL (CAAX protease family)